MRARELAIALGLAGALSLACTGHASRTTSLPDSSDASALSTGTSRVSDGGAMAADAGVAAVEVGDAGTPEVSDPSFDEIVEILFADTTDTAKILATCPASLAASARIRCLYDERYKGDAKAAHLAHELYEKWRIVAGVEVAHTMDGGYRGMIRLEPAVPVGADRKHLEWVADAMADFDVLFRELADFRASKGDAGDRALGPRAYRFRPITLRFMRSIAARTPAAYAHDWTVAYNVVGTLNISAEAVRETLFHEIFHLNDAAHGEWSRGALGAVFDAVAKKCGTSIPCLAPYSPNGTIVRGGTYYSFQPGNGVVEYAAELAIRYYREQRAALRGLAKVKPFKCGPPENAAAWASLRDEFFDGVDAVAACP